MKFIAVLLLITSIGVNIENPNRPTEDKPIARTAYTTSEYVLGPNGNEIYVPTGYTAGKGDFEKNR